MLADLAPSPVVTLNHAVAVAWSTARPPGWPCSSRCSPTRTMRRHHRLHAVRAHLLELAGRPDEARAAYARAAASSPPASPSSAT